MKYKKIRNLAKNFHLKVMKKASFVPGQYNTVGAQCRNPVQEVELNIRV